MKKVFVTMFALGAILTTQAQEAKTEKAPAAPQEKKLSKEDREAMKAKKEAALVEAFKTADFTAEQQAKTREILGEAAKKGKELKAVAKLTDEERKAKNKEINEERDAKLKALVGEVKFKAFQHAQKEQKAAMSKDAMLMPMPKQVENVTLIKE